MSIPLMSMAIRCSPLTALFPYTTLFRSPGLEGALGRGVLLDARDQHHRFVVDAELPEGDGDGALLGGVHLHGVGQRDRKSTRVNSSHVAISYAVFCWKKKRRHKSSEVTR